MLISCIIYKIPNVGLYMIITVDSKEPSSFVTITAPDFDGRIFQFARHEFEMVKSKYLKNFENQFICYVLYNDHFDKQTFGNDIYIGQSQNGLSRIADHIRGKTNWNHVLIVSPNDFDLDALHRLEADLIKRVQYSLQFKAKNIKAESGGVLCACQSKAYEKFKNQMLDIFKALRFNVFNIDTNGLFQFKNELGAYVRLIDCTTSKIEILGGSELRKVSLEYQIDKINEQGVDVEITERDFREYYRINKNVTLHLTSQDIVLLQNLINCNDVSLSKVLSEHARQCDCS